MSAVTDKTPIEPTDMIGTKYSCLYINIMTIRTNMRLNINPHPSEFMSFLLRHHDDDAPGETCRVLEIRELREDIDGTFKVVPVRWVLLFMA